MTTLIGILLGLGMATCSSVAYLLTRLFVMRHREAPLRLLVLGHVLMGIVWLAILPFLWPRGPIDWGMVLPPIIGLMLFYLLAQVGLFTLLRGCDASQISPLLAIKILILGLIRMAFYSETLSTLQWMGLLAGVAGALILNSGKGKLRWPMMAGVLVICLLYALSDINIVAAIDVLKQQNHPHPVLFAMAAGYGMAGLVGLCVLPWTRGHLAGDLRYALPWAVIWIGFIVCLFWCFDLVGVVLGAILQSSRGLISVVLGALLARLGMDKLETVHPRHVLARRIMAAICMTGAIVLYQIGRP